MLIYINRNIKEAEIKNIEDQEKQREILSKKSIVDREILAFEADIEKFYEQCDKLVKENLSQVSFSFHKNLPKTGPPYWSKIGSF